MKSVSDPYRQLFSLGILLGLIGVAFWPASLNFRTPYSPMSHGHLMVYGLFLSFVSGFLMTAMPRMLGGRPASIWEVALALAFTGTSSFLALVGRMTVANILVCLQIALLFAFAGRRYLTAQRRPPFGFVFIPVGLAWGGLGATILCLSFGGVPIPPLIYSLAKIGMQQGFLLNLILGMGSRLIPLLTRQVNGPIESVVGKNRDALLIMLGFNATLVVEATHFSPWIYLVRATVMAVAAWRLFGIHRPAIVKTFLGISIRFSVYSLVIGYLLIFFLPENFLPLLHIVFIGGFSCITIMIATRVVLAHGGHSTDLELESSALLLVGLLFLVSAAARAINMIEVAAIFWLVAVLVWSFKFGRYLRPFQKNAG